MSPAQQKRLPEDGGPAVKFAQALRDARDAAGIATDSDLAAKANFSKSAISKALNGRALPSAAIVKALAKAFDDEPEPWLQRLADAHAAQKNAPATTTSAADEHLSSKQADGCFWWVLGVLAGLAGLGALLTFLAPEKTGALEWASGTPVSNQGKPHEGLGKPDHQSWSWQEITPNSTISTNFATAPRSAAIKTLGGQLALAQGCDAMIAWTIQADGVIVATGVLGLATADRLHVPLHGLTETINITATRQDNATCATSLTWTDEIQFRA
ncbi:helix-turn-helix transcriptional regulator [Amycolatopsis sp. 195334CR]|uniref:helix-turn-helix domain-containing protein n=1 Tax=Amycolatopsis sp. 195334CR TaxID=2814588 RepID=UPI001A8DCEDD|nr:helix-turn-helix transcriptional regulator [Amycolatopsis sp. 195334CR]MBN6040039.1 helix-turn-helix transcriptional regulator [Amycolatopsis sp. 195334CR]